MLPLAGEVLFNREVVVVEKVCGRAAASGVDAYALTTSSAV
jgi:hypothetical protein